MKSFIFVLLFFIGFPWLGQAQNDTLTLLFENSYKVFELLRNDKGIYRDAMKFDGDDVGIPASVASIGMGLVSLCIADNMGWIDDAEEKALTTLKSVRGHNPPFLPDRNATGYFRHWIDMDTGSQAWNSEYSTIDSGILTCGALFCKKYFCGNDSIAKYADILWNSIDWSKAIQDPQSGGIYLEMHPDGTGVTNRVTLPFNEYMIVAWLAMNQERDDPGDATQLWLNHYAFTDDLLKEEYEGIELLTDQSNVIRSFFTIQFPFYLCHYFNSRTDYNGYLSNARRADSLWWANETSAANYQWGLGAGESPIGYHPDAINNNTDKVYSPHIISGFLPVYYKGKFDLIELYKNGDGVYTLPNTDSDTILWRKSLSNPAWHADRVQGVDYATMLFGLATLPEYSGFMFFGDYNDYFNHPCGIVTDVQSPGNPSQGITIHPNPASTEITLTIHENGPSDFDYTIYNSIGQIVKEGVLRKEEKSPRIHVSSLQAGLFVLTIHSKKIRWRTLFIKQ